MKAALAGVKSEAAIMRSPSFSRAGLSRTTMKLPFAVVGGQHRSSPME